MIMLTNHFNIRDYFDQHSTQSDTILKFYYNEGLLWVLVIHPDIKTSLIPIYI